MSYPSRTFHVIRSLQIFSKKRIPLSTSANQAKWLLLPAPSSYVSFCEILTPFSCYCLKSRIGGKTAVSLTQQGLQCVQELVFLRLHQLLEGLSSLERGIDAHYQERHCKLPPWALCLMLPSPFSLKLLTGPLCWGWRRPVWQSSAIFHTSDAEGPNCRCLLLL